MKYDVRCECGKTHLVAGADAGASLPCSCGRTVEVPPLHCLRAQAGDSAMPILIQIRGMVANRALPGTQDCACCHRKTNGLMQIGIACEPTPGDDRGGGRAFSCLLGWLVGPIGILAGAATVQMIKKESPDLSVVVPLPICDSCRPMHGDNATLRLSLRQIPPYAALLNRYPNALIVRRD